MVRYLVEMWWHLRPLPITQFSLPPIICRQFVSQMTKQLVVFNHSSLLFMLKQSCNFMLSKFPDERLPIQQLFKTLIQRGKRDVSYYSRHILHLLPFSCRKLEQCLDSAAVTLRVTCTQMSDTICILSPLGLSNIASSLLSVRWDEWWSTAV